MFWGGLAVVLTALVLVSPRAAGLPSFFVVFWVAAIALLVVLFRLDVGRKWGSKLARNALWLMTFYWLVLDFAHGNAIGVGVEHADIIAKQNGEIYSRQAAMPTLANPFRWDYVFETNRATYRFSIDLMNDDDAPPSRVIRYEKPSGTLAEALQTISQDRPVRTFLGFARFPVAQLTDPNCTVDTLVQLADLRYTEPGNRRGTFTLDMPVECPPSAQGSR